MRQLQTCRSCRIFRFVFLSEGLGKSVFTIQNLGVEITFNAVETLD